MSAREYLLEGNGQNEPPVESTIVYKAGTEDGMAEAELLIAEGFVGPLAMRRLREYVIIGSQRKVMVIDVLFHKFSDVIDIVGIVAGDIDKSRKDFKKPLNDVLVGDAHGLVAEAPKDVVDPVVVPILFENRVRDVRRFISRTINTYDLTFLHQGLETLERTGHCSGQADGPHATPRSRLEAAFARGRTPLSPPI